MPLCALWMSTSAFSCPFLKSACTVIPATRLTIQCSDITGRPWVQRGGQRSVRCAVAQPVPHRVVGAKQVVEQLADGPRCRARCSHLRSMG